MMFDDPHFAYTYIRPVAVVAGIGLGYWLVNAILDWRDARRQKRLRNVTPR
jgi:hypothetical protein